MAVGAFNIRELIRQLGIVDVHELPIAEGIQPVLQVADASRLTSQLMPPTGYAGGSSAPLAGQYSGWRIDPAPAGTWIRRFFLTMQFVNQTAAWRIAPVASALTYAAGPTAKATVNVGYQPIESELSSFQTTIGGAILPADNPSLNNGGASAVALDLRDVFIPSGFIFEASARMTGEESNAWAQLEDPTPNLAPIG